MKFEDVFVKEDEKASLAESLGVLEEQIDEVAKLCIVAMFLEPDMVKAAKRIFTYYNGELTTAQFTVAMLMLGRLKGEQDIRLEAITKSNYRDIAVREYTENHDRMHQYAKQYGFGSEAEAKCKERNASKLEMIKKVFGATPGADDLAKEAEKAVQDLLKKDKQ